MLVLVPGARLDRYELVCPVAQGGMAAVWLARVCGKAGFEKRFALKMILPQHAHEPQFQQMFLDEARIAARLVHSNAAQIVDLGEAGGILYIAMEWVEGDTLVRLARTVRARGDRFPCSIALRVLADACAGLHAAHELRDDFGRLLGVVHRDVSPHNILVSTEGVAKVIDFGIAKSQASTREATSSGTLKGKVLYMSPEQAMAGGVVDRRADVWAIGATLHYLLTGSGPFEAPNEVQSLQRLISGGPRGPLPPGTPPAVAALVDRALAHDRGRRAGTAAELHDAIVRIMQEDRTLAATSADVAAFLEQQLGPRLRERSASYSAAIASLPRAHEATEVIEPHDGATLGAASLEATSGRRATRTRVLIASAVAGAAVVGAIGAVALTRRGPTTTAAGASVSVTPARPVPPPSITPVARPAASMTPAPRVATAQPSATASADASRLVEPAHGPQHAPAAATPKPPPTPIHRDYGF